MRVLIVLSTDADSQARGVLEFDGLIEAYYLFRDAGADVVVATMGGGSAGESRATGAASATQRFKSDRSARDALNDLVDLASVCAEDFDGGLCLGPQSHNGNDGANVLIAKLLAAAKPVAVIPPVDASAPAKVGNGVLIVGNSREAPRLAANALLGVMRGR
jgi:hypothetical protein